MTSFLLSALALFVTNFIQELLSAYYLRCVTEEKYIKATVVSFVHSIIGWMMWFWFMHQFANKENLSGLDAFICSCGSAMGTYMGLKKPTEKKIGIK